VAENSLEFDLVVIGGGPGGYTGATRAAQLGFKTAIIEKNSTLGGTCLNVGCIPSKALLDSSEHYHDAAHGALASHGVKVQSVELDLPAMMSRKDKIVKDLTNGVAFIMKKNKIEIFQGTGSITGVNAVRVTSADGKTTDLHAKQIMIATGSAPVELPFAKFDGKKIISSTEALALPSVPKHMVVIGGGVIGLELGSVWLRLGAKVTVIEYAPIICGGMDNGLSKLLMRVLTKQGMEFSLNSKVQNVQVKGNEVEVSYETEGQTKTVTGDVCLVAVGRKAYTDKLGLDAVGIERDERGRVKVDHHFRTKVPTIYAIGDVIQGPMLAHKAEEEGVAATEIMAGLPGHVNYETVPGVIYTWPEFASVGATEEQLKAAGVEYRSGSFPFAANGRAKAMGSTDGQVKILADSKTDRVLGVHILGPRASDMIAEAVAVMEFGGSSEDIARSFHAHPTLAEVMREAALAVDKRARQA
jgi:dihydrolipoamide dehydrogenase